MDVVEMFGRAAASAAALARTVDDSKLAMVTPCGAWDVAALLEHMAGGPLYLLGALGVDGGRSVWPDEAAISGCVAALRRPGALEHRCQSPAGFEWSVGEAAAGTAMDQLVHTWDLAVALGTDSTLDADVTAAAVAMFLPHMPELGRQAGLVGPAIEVDPGASLQDVLLGAMGRDPRR